MDALLRFNPLETVEQLVVLAVIIVVLAFMVKYWDRVLMAITGDDRIHGTPLDCIWWTFFRCCGTCNGDWTRCFTKACCCPKRMRGANMVKEVGKVLGITTTTVEIKNIVVGDLPWDNRADFYISVECAANPPMVTSLAEEKLPKVVHFPEVLTLRLRWSPLEEQVRVTVKELSLFGSRELCSCHISAMSIIDWSGSTRDCMKRFEMKPADPALARETPPWILMELGQPQEARDLDNFHGNIGTVRTATRDGHYQDLQVREFKHEYQLLDSSGHPIQEPLEEDLAGIECMIRCVTCTYRTMLCWGLLAFFLYMAFRLYAYSCFNRYRKLTMAYMNNQTFPIGTAQLQIVVDWCEAQVTGTGLAPGVPCRPSVPQVMGLCAGREKGGHFPERQMRPMAFEGWVQKTFGIDHIGLPCYDGVCNAMVKDLRTIDVYVPGALAAFLLLVCLGRMCGYDAVRQRKLGLQESRAQETKTMRAQLQQTARAGAGSLTA